MTGADSSAPEVAGLSGTNTTPLPSSLMVPRPVTVVPPALVASRLKVSPLSGLVSLVTATRTNNLAASPAELSPSVGICTKLLGV